MCTHATDDTDACVEDSLDYGNIQLARHAIKSVRVFRGAEVGQYTEEELQAMMNPPDRPTVTR